MPSKKGGRVTFEGLPVVDADRPLDVRITALDVRKSKSQDPGACAVAKACQRMFHTDARVYLTRTYILDKGGKAWVRFITPERISREVVAFDKGGRFQPDTYTLNPPTGSTKLGYKHKPRGTGNGVGKPRRTLHATMNIRPRAPRGLSGA